MARRSLVRSSAKFLETLLDNPELPAFVARLEAPTLNKLIEHVGLEDAGSLIAYTTDRQLRSILDESLWASLAPGRPETYRPEEFIRWLYVLLEQGEDFLAERLAGLGVDYAVLNFAQLVTVNDDQAMQGNYDAQGDFGYDVLEQFAGPGAYAEQFGGHYVTAVYDEEWDVTRGALVALQNEDPEFLEHLLFRLSHDHGSNVLHDISGERRDAKERAGYVSAESATAFLELIKRTSLIDLVVGENLDPVSVRYFSELGKTVQEDARDANDDDDVDEVAGEAAPMQSAPPSRDQAGTARQRELEALLIEAEIVTNESSGLLLPAPDPAATLPVKAALDTLQHTDGALFAVRLSELVYLSNVLIAGTMLDGKRFDHVEAAHAALSTCNIGMSYLGEDSLADASASCVREGLVRLFRIGWRVLLQIPQHATQELVATLRSAEVTAKLYDRRWILAEVDATLDELLVHVGNERFDEAKTSLAFISLVIEQKSCDALQLLICHYPRYPLDGAVRFIESMSDIGAIDGFLRSLADHAKT